ncbi:phosphatidylinositol mannoside acyltransferase [Leekyejoonella antrihumi]|uniref:Phosphatidylinositol mannoside acyltransferase n=1 Tax=Leekyejoonella antrihumi TaxID=1660198 RepID=A0A563E367_9MICO|nr:phosphatidylinositol mannoside acyltransferase [Leekyejoonella antrihumi]TWP36652.1 phosphatidylinositol mannoside acyltransferase [Leekyejoonella antrihumi]
MSVGDRLALVGYRAGWSMVRRIPERAAYAMFDRAADAMWRRDGTSVQRMRDNYALVRPELSTAQLEDLVRAGVRSYLRYFCDAFRLPVIPIDALPERIRLTGDKEPPEIVARGEPIVLFLGHMGNWDLCGAWSTAYFAKVTTVAERLKPEELFNEFVEFRESLGMRILPLTGRANPFPELRAAIEAGGFVPLLADRDLTRRGVSVTMCGHPARVAVGPARLALETGAALHTLAITYEPVPGKPWQRVVAHFGPRVQVPQEGSAAERTRVMTQQCVDYLGEIITAHTQDWHMMQKVFEPMTDTPRVDQ